MSLVAPRIDGGFDDWVAGFQFCDDAERFKRAVQERLGRFGLKLHPDKTRLIEFGRFAQSNRRRSGMGKPDTFDFLGFTHCCGRTRKGKFMVLRLTSGKRMRAKLLKVKTELKKRMHQPIAEQGRYLRAVVGGHARYFAVPCTGARVQVFRFQVGRLWHRTLCRRSQVKHLSRKRMHKILVHWLPIPRICHPYPNQRLIVTTRGRGSIRRPGPPAWRCRVWGCRTSRGAVPAGPLLRPPLALVRPPTRRWPQPGPLPQPGLRGTARAVSWRHRLDDLGGPG